MKKIDLIVLSDFNYGCLQFIEELLVLLTKIKFVLLRIVKSHQM